MADVAIDDIIQFWFGPLDPQGCADPVHSARWWKKDPAFDEEIRRRFAEVHRAVGAREMDDWLGSARGRLAQIVVLDQFSRNMFRDAPAMFACDARGLQLTLEGLERGDDGALPRDMRVFFYMPLQHAEDLALQERAVALFTRLRDQAPPALREKYAYYLSYAERHRDIVARFGRFPHRNAILGRPSSDEELAFLEQPGSSF
jgi:uncharacterized protein (DUF924 family)